MQSRRPKEARQCGAAAQSDAKAVKADGDSAVVPPASDARCTTGRPASNRGRNDAPVCRRRLTSAACIASPSVRRIAREFEIDLDEAQGYRRKGPHHQGRRQARAVGRCAAPAVPGGTGIPEIPAQDFAKFGPIETEPLSRLKKLSVRTLHRSWLNIPHVTHTDEADITDLEVYRKTLDCGGQGQGLSGDAACRS